MLSLILFTATNHCPCFVTAQLHKNRDLILKSETVQEPVESSDGMDLHTSVSYNQLLFLVFPRHQRADEPRTRRAGFL